MGINGPNSQDKSQIIQNMTAHYNSLLKSGCTSLGANEMSQSIFMSLDADNSGTLEKAEIEGSQTSLADIIKDAAEDFYKEAAKFFGKSYSDKLEKANENQAPNNTQNPSERIINQNISESYEQIMKYAQEHPEDKRLQEYVAKIKENKPDTSAKPMEEHLIAALEYEKNEINFNSTNLDNLEQKETLKTLIHEMGHYSNGDNLTSVAEEVDVESYAIDTTEKITGEKVVDYKPAYLQEFAKIYKKLGYGDISPGYEGIPKNAGFTVDGKIESVEKSDKKTTIIADDDGIKVEYDITMGKKKDSEGNPYPAKVTVKMEGETGETYKGEYKNYDKDDKTWSKFKSDQK